MQSQRPFQLAFRLTADIYTSSHFCMPLFGLWRLVWTSEKEL
nr:MAG TPA: hypothetical protein [Caudoviricetes sp.]